MSKSKSLTDKYEKVCSIKDKALSLVEMQMNGDISQVDAKELGEVADIAKDMAELMKYCAEAEYYEKVTEAMDEASPEEKMHYMDKYIPEYDQRYYTPMRYAQRRDSRGRYMYNDGMYPIEEYKSDKMWYGNTNGSNNPMHMNDDMNSAMRDMREGRSGMVRKTYMDLKNSGADKNAKIEEIKRYAGELIEDMNEMLEDATPEERSTIKTKLTAFVSKL